MAGYGALRALYAAFVGAVLFSLAFLGTADAAAIPYGQAPFRDGHWTDVWTSMPQLVEPGNLPPAPFNTSAVVFPNATLRQTLQLSLPAGVLRLRFSNAFGLTDVKINAVTIALPYNSSAGQSAIVPNTLKSVTFNEGANGITVAKGALAISDPITFDVPKAQAVVSVTIYLANGQTGGAITGHPGSRTTSWLGFGDLTSAANITGSSTQSTTHWYYLSAIEAYLPESQSTFAIIGDSITDGRGSTTDANNRWPDQLLSRLQKTGDPTLTSIAIANQAAGGNRILADGLGPNVLSRIERDVLSQSGVKYVMIFEGVNDIGGASTDVSSQTKIGDSIISAYQQIISKVHAVGLPIFGATITPFSAPASNGTTIQPYSDPEREKTRQRVNKWIRESGRFDAVLDFDKVLRSRSNASILATEFDSGDYLHPNPQGYEAIAEAFPLHVFEDFEDGVDGFI